MDRLAGPVHSTVTQTTIHDADIKMPDGPAVVLPIECTHCEYDPHGSKTLNEAHQSSGPYGESMSIQRDADGHIVRRITQDIQTSLIVREERFGRYGIVDDRRLSNGKLSDEFIQDWDENGHRSTFTAKDGEGNLVSSRKEVFNSEGVCLNDKGWRANGMVEWSNKYDPATGMSEFKSYDPDGRLRLSRTSTGDRLIAFWASADNMYGSQFGSESGHRREEKICRSDGKCDHLVSIYLDKDKRNPESIELRDPDERLIVGAYYDYILDAHGNWTSRTVHVKTEEAHKPVLYEQDFRTLLYWPQP